MYLVTAAFILRLFTTVIVVNFLLVMEGHISEVIFGVLKCYLTLSPSSCTT